MAEYEITFQSRRIGTVLMERQGLYYRFSCKCVLPDEQIHSVWVLWGGGNRKLGVCIPKGDGFCLDTKVPIKYIPNSKLEFVMDHNDDFYPIDAKEEFCHMDKLAGAHFAIQNGRPGLVIPK